MKKTIIVPVGEAGSGKSTFALCLSDAFLRAGISVHQRAFAAPLKVFVHEVFDIDHHSLYGPSEAREAPLLAYRDGASPAWELARASLLARGPCFVARAMDVVYGARYLGAYEALVSWFQDLRNEHEDKPLTTRRVLQTLGTEWGRELDRDLWTKWFEASAQKDEATVVIATDGRFINEAEVAHVPILIQRSHTRIRNSDHVSEQQQGTREMRELCSSRGFIVNNDGTLDELRRDADDIAYLIETRRR